MSWKEIIVLAVMVIFMIGGYIFIKASNKEK